MPTVEFVRIHRQKVRRQEVQNVEEPKHVDGDKEDLERTLDAVDSILEKIDDVVGDEPKEATADSAKPGIKRGLFTPKLPTNDVIFSADGFLKRSARLVGSKR